MEEKSLNVMKIIDKNATAELVKRFFCDNVDKSTRWEFGNNVLYNLCKEHPLHNNEDEIVGKIWLIGRSYAAAIERRHKGKDKEDEAYDDFYYDVVALKFMQFGKELDSRIEKLKNYPCVDEDNIKEILVVHKFLVDKIKEITGMEKRSLVSKYLHFHLPNLFFIYDSRVCKCIKKIVKKEKTEIFSSDCDKEYVDFYMRCIRLREYIKEKTEQENITPRQIDNFLLSGEKNK